MKLTMTKSDVLDDWYVIERAEHDGRVCFEKTDYGMSLMTAGRMSDADVEGSADEMLDIALAIEQRDGCDFRRCAVDATSEPVRFWSPRNSTRDGECSLAEADGLAKQIRSMLSTASPTSGGEPKGGA